MTSSEIAQSIIDIIDWQLDPKDTNKILALLTLYRREILDEFKYGTQDDLSSMSESKSNNDFGYFDRYKQDDLYK